MSVNNKIETKETSAEACLAGGGEMGALMRSFDWSKTPLGPVSNWPQSLRTVVSILLSTRHPMLIFWGSELIQFYNDGFRPSLGTHKHPQALGQRGRECWAEIWDIIGLQIKGVMSQGEETWHEDQLVCFDRNGFLEEIYFTYSYSPIRDESGGVGGTLVVCTETTRRVIGERRLRALRELAAQAGEAKSVEEACKTAAHTLAHYQADSPFALLYLLNENGDQARLVGTAGLIPSDGTVSPHVVNLSAGVYEQVWPFERVLRTGQIEIVTDIVTRLGPLPGGPWPETPHTAVILPIMSATQSRPIGLLVAGISPRLALSDEYQGFLELVAGHVATAVANARAYAEERKRAEALAELDRAKTAFFSNVSHEFRTPLTLMLSPLEELLRNAEGSLLPKHKQQINVAYRNSLRLLKLVNTLLDFSRIEAGRVEAVYEPVDLANFTAELASVFRSTVERAGIHLVVDCPALPELIYIDKEMWEKIIFNLISNAFKFTFEGEIVVKVRWCNDHIKLEVRDTGSGIPEDELPHLFERFHRVRGARARTQEGSGIGLALVQELVKLHGGTVSVASVLGAGSTFTVSIPTGATHLPQERIGTARAMQSTALGAESYLEEILQWLPDSEIDRTEEQVSRLSKVESESSTGEPQPDHSIRILLADDNADMRQYVARLLSQHWMVESVADGTDALTAARERLPNLIVADVMMPGLDGFELLRELRNDPKTREIPVILLSARAGEESRVEGLEAGADDYLVKPFSARELIARVGTHLEMTRLRREAARRERELRAQIEAEKENLEQRVEERSAQVVSLARALNLAEQQERKRISQILHDDLQQLVYSLAIRLKTLNLRPSGYGTPDFLEQMAGMIEVAEKAGIVTRSLVVELNPPVDKTRSLAEDFKWLVEHMEQFYDLKVELSIWDQCRMNNRDTRVLLLQMTRELLFNTVKHAGANRVQLDLRQDDDLIVIKIKDDGKGFDVKQVRASQRNRRRFGLFSIEDRVNLIGGHLEIDSAPGQGTQITITAPMGQND